MSAQQRCFPVSRRRKRNPNDDDDDAAAASNYESPQNISDLTDVDAATYLQSVSNQAKQMPFVFVASKEQQKEKEGEDCKNDSNSIHIQQSMSPRGMNNENEEAMWQGSAMGIQYLLSDRLHVLPPPSKHHLPHILSSNSNINITLDEYTQHVLFNFSNLRTYLNQCRASGLKEIMMKKERKIVVPKSKDRFAWHVFCVGIDEARGNVGGYFHESSSDENDDNDNDNDHDVHGKDCIRNNENKTPCHDQTQFDNEFQQKQWDKATVPPTGHDPTTSLLSQFDQIIVRRVLDHHTYYISQGYAITKHRGTWIYALLARLEKPLHRDEAAVLSSLLRELCRVRNELKIENLMKSEMMDGSGARGILSILNSLIVIVGMYFEQCSSLESIMSIRR
mmetsp:Transcript_8575/g.10836  ORF Transcript_8575/g.10836 Transcript_8575/m.10836 type:complete len:392 (+) Transcript_8575:92-1267(+)